MKVHRALFVMDEARILTASQLKLRPNPYLKDLDTPYLFQKRGSLMMLVRPRMILGDDVGLGKTLEAIVTISYLKTFKPETKFLILTEMTAFKQWLAEFVWLTEGLRVKLINTVTHPVPSVRARAFRQHGADVLITGYSQIYNYWRYIAEGLSPRWVMFADEPSYFKTVGTTLHSKMFDLVNGRQGAVRSYGLTATIIENKLAEAFGVMRILTPGILPSEPQFERDYCIIVEKNRRRLVVGYKNLDHFRKTIDPVFYGRLCDDPEVEQELPELNTKDVPILLGLEQSKKLLEAMDKIIAMPDGATKRLEILPALTMAQLIADDPRTAGFDIKGEKTKALKEALLNSLMGERVVVYSKFRRTLDLLEKEINGVGLEVVRITGKETQNQKDRSKERFMSDGLDHCAILLLNKAGQRAINLQKGAHLFFYDLPWSYGLYRQIVGRLKRTGSTHKRIGVYRMLGCLHPDVVAMAGGSERTIDHYTLDVLMRKFELWKIVTGDKDTIKATESDLTDLMQEIRASTKAYKIRGRV